MPQRRGSEQAAAPRRVDALDGLRAICALAVVGYHMGLRWMSGGLLGVTVLFVLSGYLTTDGILRAYADNRGSISLRDYYVRRVRRIMPQAVVCVVLVAALCTIFNQILLTKMRPDVIPALLAFLNWAKIFSNVSYFEAAGAPSPLTHFWSLAIEWQFYLVWPPVLLLLMRLKTPKRGVRIGLIVLAAASAVLMALLYVPGEDPSRPYYGTDTRAMSLLLGCWLAFVLPMRDDSTRDLARGQWRLAVEGAGVASVVVLIVLMVVTEGYTSFSYYGGVALVSVLAVVATGALLPEGTVVSGVLSLPPLAWLGSRSYALYLWHYPIILLLSNYGSTTDAPVWMYLLQLALSLGMAELTYRFVERPCGRAGAISGAVQRFTGEARERGAAEAAHRRAAFLIPGAVVVVVALVGLLVLPPVQAAGDTSDEERRTEASNVELGSGSDAAAATTQATYDVVVIGDSVPLDAYDDLVAGLPNALVDCKISRQMSAGIELLQEYEDQGVVGRDVVICLGSNGPVTSDQLYELLGLVGNGRRLWLVNNRMPDYWQDANNELFESFAEGRSAVTVIDWYSASAGHDEWFWDDGEHCRPEGAKEYAQLIIDALASAGVTNSTSGTGTSSTSTDGTTTGESGTGESSTSGDSSASSQSTTTAASTVAVADTLGEAGA